MRSCLRFLPICGQYLSKCLTYKISCCCCFLQRKSIIFISWHQNAYQQSRGLLSILEGKVQLVSFISIVLYYPCLSSIHEKANCIAIFWMRRPQSLGSCHFCDAWATCLPHKGGCPVKYLAQGHHKRTCQLVLHNLP